MGGMTALHLAAMGGHLPIVEALLRAPGIDVTAKDNNHVRARGVRAAEAAACAWRWRACLRAKRACVRGVWLRESAPARNGHG